MKEFLIVATVTIALICLCVVASQHDADEWGAFARAHHCRVTGKKEGAVVPGVAPIIGGKGGVAVTFNAIPSQTGYLCDDGITYWRND